MTPTNVPATRACQVCGSTHASSLRRAALIRPAIAELIEKGIGRWSPEGWICTADIQRFRDRYVQSLLESEKGEISELEQQVIESLRQQEILSHNTEDDLEIGATLGQRMADRIASFGGSWVFLGLFGGLIVAWMAMNTAVLIARPFDPYPFILLNLVLSCLAAIQAPIIMMSQNRQVERDRWRALHDYQVNLKAELEIRHLHQKVDHLLSSQWERLVEIQEIQMELIQEVRGRK